jgi:hypothetical protein
MQRFTKTRLMSLIKESVVKSVSISELKQAYEAFAGAIFTASQKSEMVMLHNSLCYTKVEFKFWQRQNSLKKK